jgi:hypothetical protein
MAVNLWVQVPPGWLELVAFDADPAAEAWLTSLIDATPALLDATSEANLRAAYEHARSRTKGFDVASAGALVTVLPDQKVTVWQFTITVLTIPVHGAAATEINPMRVITQFIQGEMSAGHREDDTVETFETADGRDGVAIYTATQLDDGAAMRANIAHAEPDALGVVYAAVRLPLVPDDSAPRVALITGVAPTVAERELMAWVVAQLAVTVELRPADAVAPAGRIDVDARGDLEETTA